MATDQLKSIEVDGWEYRKLPPQLTRRFEFDSYSQTRAFLDDLAELSEAIGNYPNLHFAKDFATVTIAAADDGPLQDAEAQFARQVTDLAAKHR